MFQSKQRVAEQVGAAFSNRYIATYTLGLTAIATHRTIRCHLHWMRSRNEAPLCSSSVKGYFATAGSQLLASQQRYQTLLCNFTTLHFMNIQGLGQFSGRLYTYNIVLIIHLSYQMPLSLIKIQYIAQCLCFVCYIR